MGGGGKDGTSVLPTVNGGSAVEADGGSDVVTNKRAYVQEECLPWMYERIKLARKSRKTDTQFTEPQKIQIKDFLSSSSGAKLFAYENDDGQLRLDSNLSTQSSKEVRMSPFPSLFSLMYARVLLLRRMRMSAHHGIVASSRLEQIAVSAQVLHQEEKDGK